MNKSIYISCMILIIGFCIFGIYSVEIWFRPLYHQDEMWKLQFGPFAFSMIIFMCIAFILKKVKNK